MLAEGLKSLLAVVVEDGRAMVDVAQALKPDVIVADITMPHPNGIEALQEIEKFDPDVRVSFVTMRRDVAYDEIGSERAAARRIG
jgi:DNA-binding NarL/FixJ family response regulator